MSDGSKKNPEKSDESEEIVSSESVASRSGRQYHLGLAPGELAEYILVCSDPQTAEKTSKLFDKVLVEKRNMEFATFTGIYKGIPVSVMAVGLGSDNMEIAIIEAAQITGDATFIRIGSSGALQPEIRLGDLIITSGAVRLENTSTFFAPEGYPAMPHYEVLMALVEASEQLSYRYHVGPTATAPGFYGAQGRAIPGFTLRFPDMPEQMARLGVANFEMESSCLFTLCSIKSLRAGTVCAVYASRPNKSFITHAEKGEAETRCIKAGLKAIEVLQSMDVRKVPKHKKYWYPSLGVEKKSSE